jgi:LPXTG-site transpeptidase (sortase) family protein
MQPGHNAQIGGRTWTAAVILVVSTLVGNLTPAIAAGPPESLAPALPLNFYEKASVSELPSRLGAVQQSSLVAADAAALDEFGWAVAISGNTAVVGARNEDPDLGPGPLENAGAAYVFVRSGTTWIQEAKLVPRNAEPGDTFGVSVAIDGNIAVVGATGSDLEDASDAGAAFVFVREGITWKQKAKLVAADAFKEDNFGSSVAIDGDTIVVGADGKEVGFLFDAGAAYVFILRGSGWDQKAKLLASDANIGAYFGNAVAISGTRIVVGATEANPTGTRGPGAAYVFKGRGNTWHQEARLAAEDSRRGDFFGNSVAISGETVVVGAMFKDPDLGNGRVTNAGAAYVFEPRAEVWEQQAMLVPERATSFGQFGQSVAVSGEKIVVGAAEEEQAGYSGAGAAYLFVRSGKEWSQHTRIVADLIYENDTFGRSVALSGDQLIVGANGRDPGSHSKAGEAFVYRLIQVQLPETGFAPGRITALSPQPAAKNYADLGDLWLEIPTLGVQAPIAGVPQGGSGWDTRWLGDQAGYLEGTAFPTWEGNTGIAGHSYLPDGNPGPFVNLHQLAWGEKILIHAWGQRYVYEIREISQVAPEDMSVLKHEIYDWVTLITCRDYDKASEQYSRRTVVRAVLIRMEPE